MAPSSSSGGAASPPPPPSGNGYQRHPLQEGSGTLDEHVRDGRTFNTALWTTTFQDNQDQISYVFRDLTRRYIRGTFEEVREAARDGLEVLNDQGNLMRPEDWMVPVTVRAPPENPFHEQVDKVDNAIDAVELDVNKHLDEEIYFGKYFHARTE